eukprot:5849301-Pyramimonas_sp.AAC.1
MLYVPNVFVNDGPNVYHRFWAGSDTASGWKNSSCNVSVIRWTHTSSFWPPQHVPWAAGEKEGRKKGVRGSTGEEEQGDEVDEEE